MRIAEENWKVLALLFPRGWRQMAWQSRAVARLRAFPSPDVLLRMLLLHVARGYSLRETVVRAKLANWSDISDVALLKRLRNSEEWAGFIRSGRRRPHPRHWQILAGLVGVGEDPTPSR